MFEQSYGHHTICTPNPKLGCVHSNGYVTVLVLNAYECVLRTKGRVRPNQRIIVGLNRLNCIAQCIEETT